MQLSADAVYVIQAGRALCEQVVAENEAAMRELHDTRTQIAAFGDQIARLQQVNKETNDRASRYVKALDEMHLLVDHVYGEYLKAKHQAPGANAEALRIRARAYGVELPAAAKGS